MKRANHLTERIADPDNLRLAFWKAGKGKRHHTDVLAYGEQLEDHLSALRKEILSAQVKVGGYHLFTIYEPKERQICASAFRERVLHHGIMNICHPIFERVHIYDSYASRLGKGTYAALDRAKQFTTSDRWFLKLDVRKFFASLDHKVIKEQLKIKCYVRYMDDMILWHRDKQVLKAAYLSILAYVENILCCELKPALLNRTQHGLPFLGYRIFPTHVHLTHKSKHRFIHKLRRIEDYRHSGVWDEATCQRRCLPLLAFIQQADTAAFRKQVLSQLNL